MPVGKQGLFSTLSSLFKRKMPAGGEIQYPESALQPLPWEEKETIKAEFAQGREYFLFAGDIHPRHQLPELLKAFSHFKKWQRSEMKLLIAGPATRKTASFGKLLETYKYRNDIVLIKDPSASVLNQLIAAAYALVFTTSREGFSPHILSAMQAEVPVISTKTEAIYRTVGDAILYTHPPFVAGQSQADREILARHLVTLFRDERFRRELIVKATAFLRS